jgi:hypothetical protein
MTPEQIRVRIHQIADEALLDPELLDSASSLADLIARVRADLVQAWNDMDEQFDAFALELEHLEELIEHPASKEVP